MKCKLCDENFDTKNRIPRNLICGHCFCEQCLRVITSNEEVDCPKCLKKSKGKLPICYAILDIIDNEEHSLRDYCSIHTVEKIQFYCSEDKESICSICLLTHHSGHKVKSIRDSSITKEIQKEFEILCNEFFRKKDLLEKMKIEVEKYEELLSSMLEKQKLNLEEIGISLVKNKSERIEEYNKLIEINYLTQYEIVNEIFTVTENKKSLVQAFTKKTHELSDKFSSQSIHEVSNFNITKEEDEFRKCKSAIESDFLTNKPRVMLSEYSFDFDPKKIISESHMEYNLSNDIPNCALETASSVLFFGDSKDRLIMKYDFVNEVWSRLHYKKTEDLDWESVDYSSLCVFPNGEMLMTGGCHYTDYRNTAQKSTFIIKVVSNEIRIASFKPLIADRFSHGSLIIKNTPYVFGGHNGNESLSSLEYYDSAEAKWKFLSFMNIEREIFAFCAVKQRYIYVFGGFNNNHLDSIERYDIVYDKWKLLNVKMKRPLQNSTAVLIENSKIALIGGYNGALHKCVDILDLETKVWTSVEPMKAPRRRSHCYLHRNKIYIFGGESAESESHIPEYYDYSKSTWGVLNSYDDIVNRSLNFWSSTLILL